MKKISLLLIIAVSCAKLIAQPRVAGTQPMKTKLPPSKVDFDAFEALTAEVKEYRKDRIVGFEKFLSMSKEKNTVILDTRSTEMYNAKHIKGAIHLNFSDFSVAALANLIPSSNTRILIYCNNNIDKDPEFFISKSVKPASSFKFLKPQQELTLALNIPTFINLYGYGYKNVYELGDLISVFNAGITFEGTAVQKAMLPKTEPAQIKTFKLR